MKQEQIEKLGRTLVRHWQTVETRNPMGLTESWIKHALAIDCGVLATPSTLKRMHMFVSGEIASRKWLGLWEVVK